MPNGCAWAARAHDDLVTWVPKLEDHPEHLHRAPPTAPPFGARVFKVSDTGHSSYFVDDKSLKRWPPSPQGAFQTPYERIIDQATEGG